MGTGVCARKLGRVISVWGLTMAFSRHSGRRRSRACGELSGVRVITVDRDANQRALLAKGLASQGVVQSVSGEQVLLDSPGAPQQTDVVVLGLARSVASVSSVSARLSDAGIRLPIVDQAGAESARVGSEEIVHRVGPVLRIDDMLRDLDELVHAIRQQAFLVRGDVVRGALTLRQDGATLWNDVEVSLTRSECMIVRLLVRNSPTFVSCDAIYALGHCGSNKAAAKEMRRRTSVRAAISHIRRQFRDCDPTFRAIQSHRALGYLWNARVCPATTAGQVIHWPGKR